MIRLLSCLILLLLSSTSLFANHFTGGELRYEFTGTSNVYRVYLTLYKTCESTAINFPTFTNIYAESKAHNININKNLTLIKQDTLQPYCAGTQTSCENLSSSYPGYLTALYSDTLQLPAGISDWRLIFSNSNRALFITNLQGASGQSFYLDAPINPSSFNTSAEMPDVPPHVLFINDSIKVPLTATDKNGDSISYNFIIPLSGTSTPIPYYTGYSSSMPFGSNGLAYIDSQNNMVLKSSQTGKFTIAYRINEYRNGSYIGYTMRDFVVICVNSAAGDKMSTPEPITTKNLETFTCPGRNNTLKLNFEDAVNSDSVYLNVITPQLAGWNFNTTTTNGIGQAHSEINWTTPPSVNPASQPFFNIIVETQDNGCRLTGKATYVYRVNIRDCSADSVWPGDANSDKIVNLYDPLAVALAYKDTGSQRLNATINWQAAHCDFWEGSFLNNIDKKHADCNGDGIVDTADLHAITQNYGQVHAKGGRPQSKTTSGPDLYFTHSGIKPNPDSTVTIKMLLGNATTVTDFYGLATNVNIDGLSLSTAPLLTLVPSWVGNDTNTLNFTKEISSTSIDWAHARTDHKNVNGKGQIAELTFTIPSNTPDGTLVTLSYDKTILIDNEGIEKTDFNALQDTFYVWHLPSSVSVLKNGLEHISLYPNPAGETTILKYYAPFNIQVNISISDVTGKQIADYNVSAVKGNNNYSLDVANLNPGIYIVNVKTEDGATAKTLRLVKQ